MDIARVRSRSLGTANAGSRSQELGYVKDELVYFILLEVCEFFCYLEKNSGRKQANVR